MLHTCTPAFLICNYMGIAAGCKMDTVCDVKLLG